MLQSLDFVKKSVYIQIIDNKISDSAIQKLSTDEFFCSSFLHEISVQTAIVTEDPKRLI